mmetsp:Transcript_360/g.354  ORF Transcript_360/g.354 Transcript_360/m.354 type:complete len:255 (+) Transcript_360:625-1389(+)
MHHKNRVLYDGTQREPVKHVCEQSHDGIVVLVLHLPFKPVYAVHVLALVVPAQQMQAARLCQLQGQQGEHYLEREGSSVHKVTVEQIRVRGRGKSTYFEYVAQIIELSVSISTHSELSQTAVLFLRHLHPKKRRQTLEVVSSLLQELNHILAMWQLLLFKVLYKCAHKVSSEDRSAIWSCLETRTRVRLLHSDVLGVDALLRGWLTSRVGDDRFRESLLSRRSLTCGQLLSSLCVIRNDFHDGFEVLKCRLQLS